MFQWRETGQQHDCRVHRVNVEEDVTYSTDQNLRSKDHWVRPDIINKLFIKVGVSKDVHFFKLIHSNMCFDIDCMNMKMKWHDRHLLQARQETVERSVEENLSASKLD